MRITAPDRAISLHCVEVSFLLVSSLSSSRWRCQFALNTSFFWFQCVNVCVCVCVCVCVSVCRSVCVSVCVWVCATQTKMYLSEYVRVPLSFRSCYTIWRFFRTMIITGILSDFVPPMRICLLMFQSCYLHVRISHSLFEDVIVILPQKPRMEHEYLMSICLCELIWLW